MLVTREGYSIAPHKAKGDGRKSYVQGVNGCSVSVVGKHIPVDSEDDQGLVQISMR